MPRLTFAAAVAVLLAGCGAVHAEEGPMGTRSFDVRGFDRVSLRGSDNVVVRVGAAESVSATGPEKILERLDIKVVNGELRVGREKHFGLGWSSEGKPTVITVTLPSLRGASVAGSGDMQVDKAQATSFDASVAGSGNLSIALLQADAASIDIAGSGDASVSGQARSIDVSVAGSGNLAAQDLKSERAKISIAGSGNVRTQVSGEADVSIVGSGDVDIAGKPRCRVSKVGSGDVRCG